MAGDLDIKFLEKIIEEKEKKIIELENRIIKLEELLNNVDSTLICNCLLGHHSYPNYTNSVIPRKCIKCGKSEL